MPKKSNSKLTCVTKGRLLLSALLVVPPARLAFPLDVHLHAVLIGVAAAAPPAVVWLASCPVGCGHSQALVSAHPRPHIVDLADADPVVFWHFGQPVIEVINLFPVLDGYHVCVVLSAPGSGFRPRESGVRVVVRPAFHTAPHAHHWE